MKKNKHLNLIIKILISCIFMAFLFHNASFEQTFNSLSRINNCFWILGVILFLTGQLLNTYKWSLLAKLNGFKNSFWQYVNYYATAMFFNLFLPTNVGGDLFKCYYLAANDENKRKMPAIYTVFVERIIGLTSIIFMGSIAIFTPFASPVPFLFKAIIFTLMLFILCIIPNIPFLIKFIFKNKKWATTLLNDIQIYWKAPDIIIKSLLLSILNNTLAISIHILLGKTLGLNISAGYYFVLYPMTVIVAFLPVTFNGLGLREGAYVMLLSLVKVKSADALAFGLCWFGIILTASLIGSLFYIYGKKPSVPKDFLVFNKNRNEEYDEKIFSN